MRDPTGILGHPKTRELLDFDAPIGLLMVTIFHYVADSEGPLELMARYRAPLAEGSYLVISHATADFHPAEMAALVELTKNSIPLHPRTRAETTELFTGFDLIDPGLVTTYRWRPHPADDDGGDPGRDGTYAGVGVKRTSRRRPSSKPTRQVE